MIIETLIVYTTANPELVALSTSSGGSWYFAGSDDLLALIDAYAKFSNVGDGDSTKKNFEVSLAEVDEHRITISVATTTA